jgi:hypothetical protein
MTPRRPAEDEDGHRWSGWPGAYCHYCGREDQREIALADGVAIDNIIGNPPCPALEQEKDAIADEMNPGWRTRDAAPPHEP